MLRIANVSSVGLDDFFSHDDPKVSVLRAEDEPRFEAETDAASVDASRMHGDRRIGQGACRALCVVAR